MSRDPISLTIPDVSGFTKALRSELSDPPSHQEALNMVARAAGYRNYQHLLARQPSQKPSADDAQVTRAARYFDAEGCFAHWPARTSVQRLCLWVIWASLPPREPMSERQISARIDAACAFRDAAQIRRAMVEHKMVTRERDGSNYQRIEQAPPPEAQALISRVAN